MPVQEKRKKGGKKIPGKKPSVCQAFDIEKKLFLIYHFDIEFSRFNDQFVYDVSVSTVSFFFAIETSIFTRLLK